MDQVISKELFNTEMGTQVLREVLERAHELGAEVLFKTMNQISNAAKLGDLNPLDRIVFLTELAETEEQIRAMSSWINPENVSPESFYTFHGATAQRRSIAIDALMRYNKHHSMGDAKLLSRVQPLLRDLAKTAEALAEKDNSIFLNTFALTAYCLTGDEDATARILDAHMAISKSSRITAFTRARALARAAPKESATAGSFHIYLSTNKLCPKQRKSHAIRGFERKFTEQGPGYDLHEKWRWSRYPTTSYIQLL